MSEIQNKLLTFLNNTSEPFLKRVSIADNAFKTSELLLPHKEVVLLQWLIKNLDNEEAWNLFYNWISSDQFKELNRNDIDNEEISTIIELLKTKLVLVEDIENQIMETVISSFLILLENIIFQQYFKYNIEVYCHIICCILDKIGSTNNLEKSLKKLFFRTIILEEKFPKYFLNLIFPALTACLLKFDNNTALFEEVSNIVQKCVFYRNRDNIAIYIKQFFEDIKVGKCTVSKVLFKQLLSFYEGSTDEASIKYKLIFHAFCVTYQHEFEVVYKYFILLIHIIGFNLEENLIIDKVSKLPQIPTVNLSLHKTQEIILELLDILSVNNNSLNYKVGELTLIDFIRNLLKQILYFNTPSSTCYKIIIKAIVTDPTVIEPIIDGIIVYTMMADNRKLQNIYESLIISIFETYSKLHRIEYLVAKIVCILNDTFSKNSIAFQEIYEFKGENDERVIVEPTFLNMEDILTKNILEYFSSCICNLASWQVINVFKTLLYYLKKNLDNIDKVENENLMYFTYMEILSGLLATFLSSIRVVEHTVASTVVNKSVRELEILRNLLQQFGLAVLNREHNHVLMRSFLNIAYHWAEVYTVLSYYSINSEVQLKKSFDNDFTSCNITYLHPYLDIRQWCLISERITNFGELPCKQLLKKLFIQKVRAMLLFEKVVNDDLLLNVTRSITVDLENNWKDILYDKYVVNHLLVKMDTSSLLFISECLISNLENIENLPKHLHILNSPLLLTAVNYMTITKINRLIVKQKRKLNEDVLKMAVSSKICSLFTDDMLYEKDQKDVIKKVKDIYYSPDSGQYFEWKINEDKINKFFEILKRFPVIYSTDSVQKLCLLYLCSLHKDLLNDFKEGRYCRLQTNCEEVIIGILQYNKFKMLDVLEVDIFCKELVNGYKEWEHIFSIITENVFKCQYSIKKYESLVIEFTKDLLNPKYMSCCFIIINAANKIKKIKMPKESKVIAEKYKTMICEKILETISQREPEISLVNGYAYALRHFIALDDERLQKLLEYLNSYLKYALTDTEHFESYLTLFITLLQNQSKMPSLDENFSQKIWNVCKETKKSNDDFEEYGQLVVLIFTHVPNETFSTVSTDLLDITDTSFISKDYMLFSKQLKTWESVVSCNMNPIKIKVLNTAIERLLHKLISLLQDSVYDEALYRNIFNFEITLIQTYHFLLTPTMVDLLVLSITLIMNKQDQHFYNIFNMGISLLEQLLKHRKPLILDRLPPYLQQYRIILRSLCRKSNSDVNLEDTPIKEISDCAHQLEKLTKNLVACQKDMGRIAMYLIADVLEQYEQITLNPSVKLHLNNCIYSLISVCDQHAVTYLMRVLSSASTEIFKMMYENYKKYYRFTGKV